MNDWVRTIELPVALVVSSGAMDRVPDILDAAGINRQRLLVIGGQGATQAYMHRVAALLGHGVVRATCRQGTVGESARLASHAIEEGVTAIVSVGGGTVLDVSKFAAARTGIPFVSIPTSLANDGISSPVASLWDREGNRVSLGARMPAALIVDIDVVVKAPPNLIAAGVGDLASNLVAIADWRLAEQAGRESYDEFAALIGQAAAQMIWDLPGLDALDRVGHLARGLLLSGVAMATAGTTRPCSGGEHLVSHALDALLGREARPHGIQVGLATLMLAPLHGIEVDRLRAVFSASGLPLLIGEVGIDVETMVKALELGPSMRPGRFTILSELASRGLSPDEIVRSTVV